MISVTPIIDMTKQTNFVTRVGSTGSMVANNPTDIWGAAGLAREKTYVPYVTGDQPQGVTMYISSDNTNADNQIYISGLDGHGHFVDEIITLEGWTKKPLQNLYFRIFEAINLEDAITSIGIKNVVYVYRNSDTTEGKPDDLTAIETIIGTITNYSLAHSQMTHFTVPWDMKGYVTKIVASANWEVAETKANFYIMVSPAGRSIPITQPFFWNQKNIFALNTSGTSVIDLQNADKHDLGIPVNSGDDIVMKAFVTVGTYIVSGRLTIRLEQLK